LRLFCVEVDLDVVLVGVVDSVVRGLDEDGEGDGEGGAACFVLEGEELGLTPCWGGEEGWSSLR